MFKKAYIIGCLNWISFINAYIYGHVTGMVSSLQKREEGLDLSDDQISTMVSVLIVVSLFGSWLAAIVTDKVGRKLTFSLLFVPAAINWIILYHAKVMYQFMLSRVIGGITAGGLTVMTMFVSAEYTLSKTRAFFVNLITTVAPALGTSCGHLLSIFLHWRTAAWIGAVTYSLSILLPFFWTESPHWLASKGRFDECGIAFRRLHGNKRSTERELQLLIKMETSKLNRARETNTKHTLKRLVLAFKRKYFWDLLLLCVFMHAYFAAAGKLLFSVLATVLLEDITGTSDVFIFTMLVDGFIILGSCISCVLIRKTSIRTLLFSTSYVAIAVLVTLSACFYFKNGQTYFNWINVTLLALYFIIINTGPYPVLDTLYCEMFPLDLKLYMYSISAIILVSSLSLTITLLPYTVSAIGHHGLFLMNAAIMTVSLAYIWLKLPETKGKTLQEIEMYFKTKNFDVEEELNKHQLDTLM